MDRSTEELLELIRLTEQASVDIHGLKTEAEILRTVAGPFRKSKHFNAHVIALDENSGELRFVATSFPAAIVKLGEAIAGVSIDTFRIPVGRSALLGRVLREEKTIQVSTTKALADFLPSDVVPRILRRLHYEGTADILTPIRRAGQPSGILSITAPRLAEFAMPSVKSLAYHIGVALDLASALRERAAAESRYQDLVENLNEIFYTVDADGRITYVSPNISEIGLAEADAVGRPFLEVFEAVGPEAKMERARFERHLAGEGASETFELCLRGADGMRWVQVSSRVAVDAGRPVGLRGSIVDVTQTKRAEEALRESERILNQTGRMARIGGWEHDLRTGEAVWTRELYEIVGIDPGERLPGTKEHLEYYPPDERRRLEEAYQRAVDEGVPFDLELRCRRATGELIWGRATGEPVIEDGRCVRMRGTFQDIDARKVAEAARAETQRQLSTLMSNLAGMVYRCKNDRDRTMEFVSEGSLSVTGYAPEDLIGNRVAAYGSLLHTEDRDRVQSEVENAVARRHPFELEYRLFDEDGGERWVREQGRAVLSADGEVVALEGFIADVTEQHRAAEALRAHEERLALALEATSDGLWDWDAVTGEAYFSPRCYEMLGYEPYEFPSTYEAWKAILHPDDGEAALQSVRDHIADRDDRFEVEYRMRTRDSSWLWILNRGGVVERDAEGRPARLLGTHVDITSRKENAVELAKALDGTIRAIARTVELRDPYTAGHQERSAFLACAIAHEMGHDADLGDALRVAGLIHDVGKISVPSEILSKPTRLTDAELRLVQGHAEASFRILEGIDFPWPIAEIVRQHHERLDGSGYPQGLRGDEICLGARILAVADVVEAIASHRPYRPALGLEVALSEIERARGAELDPDVVDACLRLFRERGLTLEALDEKAGDSELAPRASRP